MATKPGGSLVSLSPWEFQMRSLRGKPGEKLARLLDREVAVAVFARLAERDLAAEEIAHELHAIANAEHRHAELENLGSGCGAVFAYTLCGPPERMMPMTPSSRSFAAGVEK